MTTTSDQMQIFDTPNGAPPFVTVIDVRAGLMSPTVASLHDIGFLDVAKIGRNFIRRISSCQIPYG
jgi:hypothetical protein